MKELNELNIKISDRAKDQIKLMLEHDYTITERTVRISIDGKGCSGFDYAVGFDKKNEKDSVIPSDGFEVVMDPFCAHYCSDGELDYLFDIQNDIDGFIFTNKAEKNYRGKFFKDESKAIDPSLLE